MSKSVPEGWKNKKLVDVGNVTMGQSPSSNDVNDSGNGVPFLQGNAEFSSNNPAPAKWCTSPLKLANKGDILLSVRAPVGALNIADQEYCIGRGLAAIRFNKADSKFGWYALFKCVQHLKKISQGSTFESVNKKNIEMIEFILPSLPEQRKIAVILSSVDEAIEKTKTVIEQTKIVKKGLMQELLTRGIPGRHKKFKKTPVGEIPEEWEVVRLGDIAKVQTGVAKNSKKKKENPITLPYLRVANVQDGFVDLSEIKHIVIDKNKAERYLLQKGDVLFNEGGDNDKLGRGCVWEAKINPCAHQNHVFAVRCSSKISPYYLAIFAASTIGKQFFLNAAKQTTNLASINSSQLKLFPISLPSPEEQHKIINIIRSIDNNITAKQELLDSMQNMKSALMQILLTGEVRVTV